MGAWNWSVSSSRRLASCPKAFHFGEGGGEWHGSRSPLIPIGALPGLIVHSAISETLDLWASGSTASPLTITKRAQHSLAETWKARTNRIAEFANGLEMDNRTLETASKTVDGCLERFFSVVWPQFSLCRHVEHETLHIFHIGSQSVTVRPDLACWGPDGDLWIVEWKTGGWSSEYSGRIQLATYALWAVQELGIELERLLPMTVGLRSGSITRFRPVDEDLSLVREMIASDRKKVAGYARGSTFPASAEPSRCSACPFLWNCAEGTDCIGL